MLLDKSRNLHTKSNKSSADVGDSHLCACTTEMLFLCVIRCQPWYPTPPRRQLQHCLLWWLEKRVHSTCLNAILPTRPFSHDLLHSHYTRTAPSLPSASPLECWQSPSPPQSSSPGGHHERGAPRYTATTLWSHRCGAVIVSTSGAAKR